MAKTIVYVDGFNLYHRRRQLGKKPLHVPAPQTPTQNRLLRRIMNTGLCRVCSGSVHGS